MAVTIYDVAKRAGVAASTVSKYINNGVLRKDVRERVQAAIEELGYVPNDLARGLKTLKSFTVGIVIPTLDSSFTAQLISYIEQRLQCYGYGLLICDCGGKRDTELEKLAFLERKIVDAFVLLPSAVNAEDLEKINKTIVLFDKPVKGFNTDTVLIDNEKAGYIATKYLLDRGHRNIAIIVGGKNVYTSDLRLSGYMRALEEYGVRFDEKSVIHTDFTVNTSYLETIEYMKNNAGTTAIFATNADTTMGCVMALNYLNINIPNQISVVGFDNIIMSKVANPSITIISQPLEKLGSKIAEILLKRLNGEKSPPIVEMLDIDLVEGSSVKNLNS